MLARCSYWSRSKEVVSLHLALLSYSVLTKLFEGVPSPLWNPWVVVLAYTIIKC